MKLRRIVDFQAPSGGSSKRSWALLLCCALLPESAWCQPAKSSAGPAPCAAQPPPSGPRTQGRSIQGRSVQGRSVQGRSMEGQEVAVSTVQQVTVKGTPVQNLHLQGTQLVGTASGKSLAGADFVGATVSQNDADGAPFSATITEVRTDPQDASCEVMLYKVMVKTAAGTAENLCDPDPWNERWAIPVAGSWDSTGAHVDTPGFMFACTSGVVAKCIRWGYRPWKKVGDRSLADYHQACTRMARADYCGDGVSHTENGTLIDMYDRLKIQTRSPPSLQTPLLFDAAWTPSGAYCIAKERWLKLGELPAVLSCQGKFKLLPGMLNPAPLLGDQHLVSSLVKRSPIDPLDLCLTVRDSLSPDQVLMDNQSGINIKLP